MIKKKVRYFDGKIGLSGNPSVSIFYILKLNTLVFFELFKGFIALRKRHLAVTFFGSARESLPERYYEDASMLGAMFAKKGFSVITGGAEGIMRAGNQGAHRAGGDSVGFNIKLPHEQDCNMYSECISMRFFFIRKLILSYASEVYVFFPGGYGTFDELFNILTLIQTKKVREIPIILYGRDFWEPFIKHIVEAKMEKKYKTISTSEKEIFFICDSVNEVERCIDKLNLKPHRQFFTN